MDEFNKLRIVHCFRSPVGGIFRHVRDLVEYQNASGHDVGILCDSITGGAHEDQLFEALRPLLRLGLHRIPMRRTITPGDLLVLYKAYQELKKLNPNILHAHGSKGGAYARIIGTLMRRSNNRLARLYCPHGGSIHYDSATLKGKLFFFLERSLEAMTDRLIFVSKYERDGYTDKVGLPRCPTSLVYNGLQEGEFDVVEERGDAADFLYIGMMRDLKGPDLFIDAIAALAAKTNKKLTAHMVGDGPDKEKYVRQVAELNIGNAITFHDAMPARRAFAMAKIVVVPSRAESMPYIVLEAIAAQKPIIASRVGGIPEIFADEPELMVEPDDAKALETSMRNHLDDSNLAKLAKARAKTLKNRFSMKVMARDVEAAYLASL